MEGYGKNIEHNNYIRQCRACGKKETLGCPSYQSPELYVLECFCLTCRYIPLAIKSMCNTCAHIGIDLYPKGMQSGKYKVKNLYTFCACCTALSKGGLLPDWTYGEVQSWCECFHDNYQAQLIKHGHYRCPKEERMYPSMKTWSDEI